MIDAPQMTAAEPSRCILGVRFFTGTAARAVEIGMQGGLVVVPAAPALVELGHDVPYREALLNADLAITDSALMVLSWWMIAHERLPRVSGLEYLKLLLIQPDFRKPSSVLWIMPTPLARERNLQWLRSKGIPTSEDNCYVAPVYSKGDISDPALLERIHRQRPAHVVVGLGGGVQERLGLYLKRNLDYLPGIHCIGAAIGFLSGEQVRIPPWADFLYLGWLFRCVSEPKKFVPRYWRARKLVAIMRKHRDRMPDAA